MARKRKHGVATGHQSAPTDRAVADIIIGEGRGRQPAPGLKIHTENGVSVSIEHDDKKLGLSLLMAAVGTTDASFFHSLVGQLLEAGSKNGQPTQEAINFMLSVVKGVEPRNQVEAMLAAQMAAVHMQTMVFARKLADAEYIDQQDSAERAFNKLARTFTTQLEALNRYCTGGQQRVTVEHVNVNAGGQAIVGNLETGGRGHGKGRR
jgi:hypothetical protein